MELDLTTFLMEVVNFLILVWIMNRILYKPVLGIIAARQERMERTRSEAERLREEASRLEQTFQGRLASWDSEKAELRRRLQAEIAADRERLAADLDAELAGMREKARVAEERRTEELVRLSEERAIANAGRFASRLLTRLATPELGMRLLEMLLEDLAGLPDEQRRAIAETLDGEDALVGVTSAHILGEDARKTFEARFLDVFPTAGRLRFTEDASLLAGVRVTAGPWNLAANLRDELAFFRGGVNGP
jgi:F-type H+-transporting ATPase subunit b